MRHDPLYVVNPKVACSKCGGDRKHRKNCEKCYGTGFIPVDLNGLWAPSAGFLIGGGPSINKIPKEKFQERGIVSLAINNVAGHIRTSAWCFGDPQTKFHHGIHLDPRCLTFAPNGKLRKQIYAKLPDGTFRLTNIKVGDCPGVFGISRTALFDAKHFFTSSYAMWGRGGKQPEEECPFRLIDTFFIGLRLMHYLGCPRVYLLGVDFNMVDEQPYAFEQTKSARNGRYHKLNNMLADLLPVFKEEGFQVFNCNPDSHCNAFPKVSFEEAFEDCKGAIPEEPFNLADWYSKHISEADVLKNPVELSQEDLMKIQNEARKQCKK